MLSYKFYLCVKRLAVTIKILLLTTFLQAQMLHYIVAKFKYLGKDSWFLIGINKHNSLFSEQQMLLHAQLFITTGKKV